MPTLQNLPVSILAALILLLTPSPAVLYIIARSIDQAARKWLKGNPSFLQAERYIVVCVYIGLGLAAALAGMGTS
ncbi:MAG: hypothetical protein HY781_07055 [Chloroflexi bacterium]|nr:hypothetical protein [Chloroflexota bacterium]